MHQNQTKQQSFSIDVAVAFTGLERTCLFCKWQKKTASTSATSSATVRASARPTAAAAAVTTPRRPTIQRRSASRVSAPALAVPASWTSSCPAWRSSASNPTPARSPDICTLCPATSSKVGPLDFNYLFFDRLGCVWFFYFLETRLTEKLVMTWTLLFFVSFLHKFISP